MAYYDNDIQHICQNDSMSVWVSKVPLGLVESSSKLESFFFEYSISNVKYKRAQFKS